MFENSDNRRKTVLLLAIVLTLSIYLFWLNILLKRQTALSGRINKLTEKVNELEIFVLASRDAPIIGSPENTKNDEQSYIDIPSPYPRLSTSAVFPLGEYSDVPKSVGRGDLDMSNVAVLVEATNWNDTERMINSITAQRKSEEDLKIFLYTPTEKSGVEYDLLKSWSAPESNIISITETDQLNATLHVLRARGVRYVITLSDYNHIGDDFADFYFAGKRVMEVDGSIHAVCGTSNFMWQDRNLGDVLWLSDAPCSAGEMVALRSIGYLYRMWVRPETARVGPDENSVTKDSPWNIDRFNPLLMREAEFLERLSLDISHSEKRPLEYWAEHGDSECDKDIRRLIFLYESVEDLKIFFTTADVQTFHRYNHIFTLSRKNCRLFIIPKRLYEEGFEEEEELVA